MAARVVWSCIICGTRAEDRPPRHCPTCGAPAAKWRMLVDRDPSPPPPPEEPAAEGEEAAEEGGEASPEGEEAAAS